MTNSSRKKYEIVLLTDRDGWILPYLERLVEDWHQEGHCVSLLHEVDPESVADFCFCLSFGKIVPGKILENYKKVLVVHESNLPEGRGWAPMAWQILEGRRQIPVTLLEAAKGVDSGRIYMQDLISLNGTELNSEWRGLQAESTVRLCKKWVDEYPAVLSQGREQEGVATFYKKRTPADSELDVERSIASQFDLLRVVDNDRYPAFFFHKGRGYKIKIDLL